MSIRPDSGKIIGFITEPSVIRQVLQHRSCLPRQLQSQWLMGEFVLKIIQSAKLLDSLTTLFFRNPSI